MNKLFVLVGPSGAGKTLISTFLIGKEIDDMKKLIATYPLETQLEIENNFNILRNSLNEIKLNRIITSTSRKPRENEVHGVDYFFYPLEEFREKIENGYFLEHVENFGNLYGTCYNSIRSSLEEASSVIVLDDAGAIKMKELLNSNAVTIYLNVSERVMEKRMNFRNEDSCSLNERMTNLHIMAFNEKADFVVNGERRIDLVLFDILEIIKKELNL